jgi:hypothetical protein
MAITSDATEAYRLVDGAVQLVERTLVFLKPDVLLVLDRVKLTTARSAQLRFQVFNDDGSGSASATAAAFAIERPLASLAATVHSSASVACTTGQLDLPANEGVFPFVEATSGAATEHTLLTVATTAPRTESHGRLTVLHQNGAWTVAGTHRGRTIAATLALDAAGAVTLSL